MDHICQALSSYFFVADITDLNLFNFHILRQLIFVLFEWAACLGILGMRSSKGNFTEILYLRKLKLSSKGIWMIHSEVEVEVGQETEVTSPAGNPPLIMCSIV